MEYLTLDQKKKALNIRANDMKLDGALSVSEISPQGLGVFNQYDYPTTVAASFLSQSVPITILVTQIGKKIIIDVPQFILVATNGSSSYVEIAIPPPTTPMFPAFTYSRYFRPGVYTATITSTLNSNIFYAGPAENELILPLLNTPYTFSPTSLTWSLPQ